MDKKFITAFLIISSTLNASFLEINLKGEISLANGTYIAKEDGGQGRYVLISHDHGSFETEDNIAEAECTNGFVVSKLPSKFKEAKKHLRPTDYILTKCREVN